MHYETGIIAQWFPYTNWRRWSKHHSFMSDWILPCRAQVLNHIPRTIYKKLDVLRDFCIARLACVTGPQKVLLSLGRSVTRATADGCIVQQGY